jgi:disulfide bond formation protein DsbB
MPILLKLMAFGTVFIDGLIIFGALAALNKEWRSRVLSKLAPHSLNLIFLLSAGGALGALLLEFAGGLAPCLLCWWQRIFMFPVAIISGIAIAQKKKASEVADYVLALSIPGAAVALYQHLMQMTPQGTFPAPCDAANDCAVRSFFEFGFVTLPWMAFTLFAALIFIALLAKKTR